VANIPVERTGNSGGTPWWVWLLGALILLALIWFLVSQMTGDDRDRAPATAPPTTAVDPARPADTGPITDPRMLADAPDGRTMAGRQVQLSNMRVEVAYSDSAFYAVPADHPVDRRFFVVVGNPATPGIGGPSTLQVGDVVTVHGTVHEPTRNDLQRWDIAENERDRLMRYEDYYIRADRVDHGNQALQQR
jgi:hypothetical protein